MNNEIISERELIGAKGGKSLEVIVHD